MKTSLLIYDTFETQLGKIYLVFSGRYLCGLSFRKPAQAVHRKGALKKTFRDELKAYFNGTGRGFSQETLYVTGTDFEKSVWDALRDIPFGETRSYKWLAEKIGNPGAVRAVGRALSKNPLPVVIPCHRIIESDGSLGGFSSGVRKKRRLLDMEYYAQMN